MDVYLVPVAQNRHELYCEVPDVPDEDAADDSQRGFFSRMRARFREMLAEAERERRQARVSAPQTEQGFLNKVKVRLMRWVAESIAEQRLLWHLRRQTEVCLHYPDDLEEAEAMAAVRAQLTRDYEKHRRWLIIDGLLFIVSGLFMLVPGPNILAYYFAFRLVGHYLSMRGAKQGLSGVTWRTQKSGLLSELRRLINLDPAQREQRVQDVAVRLRLEHLATFFERTAVPS
jgi:hypothetical protein